jgi:hypothetical protein
MNTVQQSEVVWDVKCQNVRVEFKMKIDKIFVMKLVCDVSILCRCLHTVYFCSRKSFFGFLVNSLNYV